MIYNIIKNGTPYAICFFLLFNTSLAVIPDQYEPDNSSSVAKNINPEATQTRSITPANDEDWVKFTLNQTEYVEIKTSGLSNTRIILYDQYLTQLAISNGYVPGNVQMKLTPGTYYSLVYNWGTSGEIDTYYFKLSTTLGGGDQYEADNNPTDATAVINNSLTQKHSIFPPNEEDWIKFSLTQNDTVELKTTGVSRTRIALYDADLNQIAISNGYKDGYINRNLGAGTYYVLIYNWASNSSIPEYDFHITADYLSSGSNDLNNITSIIPILELILGD